MYDPNEDPRYVPIEADLPAEEREFIEAGLSDVEENIKRMDQILVMFAHPGWEFLSEGFDRLADELDVQLKSEKDLGTWKFYRGQLAQVDWMIQLPAEIADKQRKLRRDHAALLRSLGKE